MTFSEFVTEQVGWYVYALRDPRDASLFYIGKGRGNRVFQHAHAALAPQADHEMSPKIELIKAIHDAGLQVESFIVRHGISSESAAYEGPIIGMVAHHQRHRNTFCALGLDVGTSS
jgi:uncharacterized protein